MIKTRILERRQGSLRKMKPQYLKDYHSLFGMQAEYQKWVDIGRDEYTSSMGSSYTICMALCKEKIDEFLMGRGYSEQVVHWYPEVQDD